MSGMVSHSHTHTHTVHHYMARVAPQEEAHVVAVLERLAQQKMSAALLKRTLVGRTVNHIRKECSGQARARAKELLDSWKAFLTGGC